MTTFKRNLKRGCKGDDVRDLQALLNQAGADLTKDGSFGSKTTAAVKAYQKSKDLTADGIAGKNTITALGGTWADKPYTALSVCTFNIKRGTYKKGTPAKIAEIIKNADIAGVQEITPKVAEKIAAKAGMRAYMCSTLKDGYGHCIFTRFISKSEEVITMKGGNERRKVHRLQIEDVAVYNCHLDYHEDTNRTQIEQLAAILKQEICEKVIVTGDFNRQNFPWITSLGFIQHNQGQLIADTEGGASIVNKIDQIFTRGFDKYSELLKYNAVKHQLSDHDALFLEAQL